MVRWSNCCPPSHQQPVGFAFAPQPRGSLGGATRAGLRSCSARTMAVPTMWPSRARKQIRGNFLRVCSDPSVRTISRSWRGRRPSSGFVNQVLAQAIRDRASDIHFEPFAKRIQDSLHASMAPSTTLPSPPPRARCRSSRVSKSLADLNIAERRVPQDGRIRTDAGWTRGGPCVVERCPTQFGESVVLRCPGSVVSPRSISPRTRACPGISCPEVLHTIRRPSRNRCLVTGPTGSGKTTTLYSGLERHQHAPNSSCSRN